MASVPTSCSGGSTMMPCVPSSPMPSSSVEQIMPWEVLPYVLRAAIAKSPGRTAPGRTTTTLSPTEKLRAPQTISCGSPVPLAVPTSTVQKRMGFLNPSSSSMVRTCPTTRGPLRPAPICSTVSTSSPTETSLACTSRPVSVSGRSTYSRSQESGTRIRSPSRTAG